MIWSTYHVFGSGSAGVVPAGRNELTIAQYITARNELSEMQTDDGHNDFVGTFSVPDDEAERRGVWRDAWFDPGPRAKSPPPGFVTIPWNWKILIEFRDAGLGDVTLKQLYDVTEQADAPYIRREPGDNRVMPDDIIAMLGGTQSPAAVN